MNVIKKRKQKPAPEVTRAEGGNVMIQIKNIINSLRDDVISGKMTLEAAAAELYNSGWTTSIDVDATRRRLHLAD